jgi:RNA polymerase sigma-70 factor (ECF subfamily)
MELTHAIARSRAGDKAAYEEVVSCYANRLVRLLHRVLGNIEDARDIAQETFVRAFLNLHRYDLQRPFEPWLYRIARNLAFNHLKAIGRRLESRMDLSNDQPLERIEGDQSSPLKGLIDGERKSDIHGILSAMRPVYREVLTLRYMAKLEYEDIAARMSIPRGTVKTWLNRAKEQFRELARGSDLF